MDNQTWISKHLNELNEEISSMIFDDPALITDPTNLDELHDKLTDVVFKRHELPMRHYQVEIEPYGSGGYRVCVRLIQ